MHDVISARNLVRSGLALFFIGAAILLAAAAAQVAPGLSAWFVPEGPFGYTAAATLVCWGVWAMGAGLRMARETRVAEPVVRRSGAR